MKVLLFIASLFLAQDAATTATITGRIAMDDGGTLPMVTTFRGPALDFGLLAVLPEIGSRVGEAAINVDGSFQLALPTAAGRGNFTVVAWRKPLGYYVKSMTHGSVDLLRSPLTITPTSAWIPIQVVLTKTPPAGLSAGVKVSGRVTNWTTNAPPIVVSLQFSQPDANGVRVLRLGTTNLKPDGTFEISGVPAGRYRGFTPTNSRNDLIGFEVADKDVSGLEITLPTPDAPSIIMTSVPFAGPIGRSINASPLNIAAPRTPLQPQAGSAVVSIAQSGGSRVWRHGAVHFFRIERSADILEEKRPEANAPLAFTLAPGSYELRSYSRGCDENCSRLGPPEILCATPLNVAAGQVLYVERVLQNSTCTIQFNAPPAQ
jgi:hypothetical protein